MSRRRLLLAIVTAAMCLSTTAAAQTTTTTPPGGTPPTPDTPATLAAKSAKVNAAVAALEAQLPTLAANLAATETKVTAIGGSITDEQRRASELLIEAKQQALSAYLRGDIDSQPYAVALAMGQKNSNDAAWSIGILQVSNRRTVDLVQAAKSRGSQASRELTDALTAREKARDALDALNIDIRNTRVTSKVVADELTQSVVALAPSTIDGLTTVAYDAYRRAAVSLGSEKPKCGLRWELLAAIGRTESNHGLGRLDNTGRTSPPILGPSIGADTDKGEIDTDPAQDHAVGPMQFIPSTWRNYGADGNGDGKVDINNIYDEALAAGRYLCVAAGALTLNTKEGVTKAILAYNPNQEYLRVVGGRFEALAQDVARGWFSSAALPTAPPPDPNQAPATGGGAAPFDPIGTPTANTQARTLSVFGPTSPANASPGEPVPAVCESATARMAPRVGLYRCTVGAEVLDPCIPAPYDLTVLACVTDPEQPTRLVKVGNAMPSAATQTPPPFFALILPGADRCLPVIPANAAPPVVTPTTTTTAAAATTSTTAPPASAAPTVPTTPPRTAPAATTTVAATTTTSAVAIAAPSSGTTTTTTLAPKRAMSLRVPASAAAPQRFVPAATPDTVAEYRCASGAEIIGQPAVTSGVWTAIVRQPGINERQVPIAIAWQ